MITQEQLVPLMRSFYDCSLERDSTERLKTISETRAEIEGRVHKHSVWELERHLARGEFSWVRSEAEALIARLGLSLTPDDIRYREVCQSLLRVKLEAARRTVERDNGDWAGTPRDPLLAQNLVTPAVAQASDTERTALSADSQQPVSVLIEKLLREKRGLGRSALNKYRVAARLFNEYTDRKAIGRISRGDVVGFKDMLIQLPANWTKHFPGKTPREVLEANAKLARPFPTLSARTINDGYLTYLQTFFKWAVLNDLLKESPAAGVAVATPKGFHRRNQRDPFSIEKLKRLFAAPIFTGCASAHRPYDAGTFAIRDHRYWAPFVALFSGVRANELGQLEVTDVQERAGIWCLHITTQSDGEDPEDAKHIKTAAGHRVVPLHPELKRLGFLDYVAARRTAGDRRVFPAWKKGNDGTFSSIFGKFFNNRLLTKLGIKTPKIVFHSLRHNFMDAMRQAGIQDAIKKAIIGHSDSSVTALYGSGEPLSQLAIAIAKVRYEGLDLNVSGGGS